MIGDKKTTQRRSGFTLVEALVVLSIFTILLTSMCDIFVQSSRFGRDIVLRAKLQADARNTIEAVARAVRVSNIDYAAYGGTLPAQPTSELRLINPRSGDTARIRLDATDGACYSDGKSFPCINVSTNGGTAWAPLSPRGTKVDQLLFYVTPPQDPFLFDQVNGFYASNNQPIVTMLIKFHGLGLQPKNDWVYTLQTSITPRLYLR
jgi:prepilin-type N-terminal cleavage/methylation domain-containing protein